MTPPGDSFTRSIATDRDPGRRISTPSRMSADTRGPRGPGTRMGRGGNPRRVSFATVPHGDGLRLAHPLGRDGYASQAPRLPRAEHPRRAGDRLRTIRVVIAG